MPAVKRSSIALSHLSGASRRLSPALYQKYEKAQIPAQRPYVWKRNLTDCNRGYTLAFAFRLWYNTACSRKGDTWGVSTVGRTSLPYFIPKTVNVGQAVNGESAQNLPRKFGALAQLVARNVRIVEVRGSNPLRSTKRPLREHLLFQRRLCNNGVAVMATKKRGSRFCALTLVLWLLCVCVLLLCFLPFREFLLPLLAVIVFAYFGDEETGKGFYDGRWKLNIIFVPSVFLICQIVQLPNLQFLKCKSFSFRTPFWWCIPSLAFRMWFRWTLLYKLPLPLIWDMGGVHRRFSVPAILSFPCAPRTADADLPPARFQAGKRTVQRGSDRGSFVRRILTTAHPSFAARTIPFSLPTRGNIRPDRKAFCAASPKTLGAPFALFVPSCAQLMEQNDPASHCGQNYKGY